MKIKQVVQVDILGSPRSYTYEYFFEPGATPSLRVGDRVELPPNQVQEEGSSGTVAFLGSDYEGPMKEIVRKLPDAPKDDVDLWGGWEEYQ